MLTELMVSKWSSLKCLWAWQSNVDCQGRLSSLGSIDEAKGASATNRKTHPMKSTRQLDVASTKAAPKTSKNATRIQTNQNEQNGSLIVDAHAVVSILGQRL